MSTKLKLVSANDSTETFSFNGSVTTDELSQNAMGGTELMKYGLHQRLNPELRDKFNIICSRVRETSPDKHNILWLHDLAEDPEARHLSDPTSRARFDKLVFVSNWQMQAYNRVLGVPYADSVVLRNAINPIPVHDKPNDGTINLIYHTTPHRGLEILVPVFEELSKHFDNIHLDVYSSFKIYGWEQRDEPYKQLFERIKAHPKMTYHGSVSNEEVRKALQKAHIYAYPSIWPETSCISAMEAMSAGVAVVAPNLAALPETLANLGIMYQWHEDKNRHANIFANTLASTIQMYNSDGMKNRLQLGKVYADAFYSWEHRVKEWEAMLNQIIEHPNGI